MARNIIQKTIIDLHYDGNADGFVLQQQLGDWCNHQLAQNLEIALQNADAGDTVKKIDRVELEIDISGKENWLSVLSKEMTVQLKEKLESIPFVADSTETEETLAQHFFESFIYFLQNGHLPWWSPIKTKNEFSDALSASIKEGLNRNMKDHLLQILSKPATQQRLSDQLTETEFLSLAAELYNSRNEAELFFKDVIRLISIMPAVNRRSLLTRFKHLVLEHAGDARIKEALQQVAHQMASQLFSEINAAGRNKLMKADIVSSTMKEALQQPGKEINDKSQFPETKIGQEDDSEDLNTEPVYVYNAGLVIVAPFLPALFKKLKLATEDTIVEKDIAVNLTAYLASGKEHLVEFELVLPKILCGIHISAPISTQVQFTKAQKNEAQELLQSAIEYWSVLKNTSADALRESFLLREGKLSFKNKEWLLQVEQKPYDMLLQSLPWNISMIKFSWMRHLLKTEWIF